MIDTSRLKTVEDWHNWVKSEDFRYYLGKSFVSDPAGMYYQNRGVAYSGFEGFNYVQSQHWAQQNNGITIERTIPGEALAKAKLGQRFKDKPEIVKRIWDEASTQYAKCLTGDVKAFTMHANKEDVFYRVELPILLKNKGVTSINGISKQEIQLSVEQDRSLRQTQKLLSQSIPSSSHRSETVFYEMWSVKQWYSYERVEVRKDAPTARVEKPKQEDAQQKETHRMKHKL